MTSGDLLVQQTLTGEDTDAERVRPSTWLWCDECDDAILRSERFDHEHDLDGAMAYEKAQVVELDEKIPDHAKMDTQMWEVTFYYEYAERVIVEASGKGEAKEEAKHIRTFDGELIDTIHTEKRELSEPSQASIEYLEMHRLLPDDHDVTKEDIERVLESDLL